jgi:hypothetical protein
LARERLGKNLTCPAPSVPCAQLTRPAFVDWLVKGYLEFYNASMPETVSLCLDLSQTARRKW